MYVTVTYISWCLIYILKTIWCMDIILWDYESVWHDIWPQNKCRSLWPVFHGPVILLYILKTIWYMNIILWDYELVCPMFDFKIFVGHCDLYFMVQWFCLIAWKLFSGWTLYFGTMSQYDPTRHLTSKYLWVTVTYISWYTEFALYLEDCLMYEHCPLGFWVGMTRHLTSK